MYAMSLTTYILAYVHVAKKKWLVGASRDIPASLDSVWNVIADIDREPEFWHGTNFLGSHGEVK
jgi:hypothetical protein